MLRRKQRAALLAVIMRRNAALSITVIKILLTVFLSRPAKPSAPGFPIYLTHGLFSAVFTVFLQSAVINEFFAASGALAFSNADDDRLTGTLAAPIRALILLFLFLAAFRAEPGAGAAKKTLAADRADPRGKRCTW